MKECESICWNCKRAAGNLQYTCSWATNFEPVKGWKTVPNEACKTPNKTLKQGENEGKKEGENNQKEPQNEAKNPYNYCVIECPLYSQFSPFLDYSEAVKAISKACKCTPVTFYRNPLKWIKKYEEMAQVTVPEWVKYRGKFGDE